jgi:hypothetical protein
MQTALDSIDNHIRHRSTSTTSQLQVLGKTRFKGVIPLGGTTNQYKIVDLLHNVEVSLLELCKISSSVPCLASLHLRARWRCRGLLHDILLYCRLARLQLLRLCSNQL